MNNQQAINLLKGLEKNLDDYCELNDEGKTAFGMAITALELFGNSEQLPSIQPDTTTYGSNVVKTGKNDGDRTSGDCISRQQAIDALRAMQTYKMFAGDDLLLIDQAGAQTELMMLPSAQPEPEAISEWKKEFKGYVDSLNIARDDWKGIIEYIDELPSVQPEQAKMIKEIRRWINSKNRGNADYFIVDRIEEIINAYE